MYDIMCMTSCMSNRAVDINRHACLCTSLTLSSNGVSKCDVLTMDLVCHNGLLIDTVDL